MFNHARRAGLGILFGLLMSIVPGLAQGIAPSGTYTFAGDSDGGTTGKGSNVTITFTPASGAVVVHALRPGETFTDNGNYRVAGHLITLSLPQLGISVSNQPFTMTGATLVLPFKVFSEGAGTSTWMGAGPASGNKNQGAGNSGGSSTSAGGAGNSGTGLSSGSGAGSGSGSGSGSG